MTMRGRGSKLVRDAKFRGSGSGCAWFHEGERQQVNGAVSAVEIKIKALLTETDQS